MFICSDKCISKNLPFQSLTNKVFLDTVIGKRKIPCKICGSENVLKLITVRNVLFARDGNMLTALR